MWWTLLLTAYAGTGDDAYTQALEAWNWGHWRSAFELASDAVAAEPDDAAARLLQGFALSRMRQWEDGVALVRPLVDDEEVGAHARYWVRRHDRRWTRQDWALSATALLRSDRDRMPILHSGIGLSVDAPVSSWMTVRLDGLSPVRHSDQLQLYGVQVALTPLAHYCVASWSFHAGLGPSLLIGESAYWGGAFKGVFPGGRATLGADSRMSRLGGLRMQLDYDVQFGARRFLRGVSHGYVLRAGYVLFL
ncbi:MAG: hypothetical protein KC912_24915 [Proteobacteria bacterium]|nr:hypothetical protein [Pseudomonadota bacterium]